MGYNPTSGEHFTELEETGIDSNSTLTVTASLHIEDNAFVAFEVRTASGTHATHIITLQQSFDNSTWTNTSSTVTGTGLVDNIQITSHFCRLKVTTAEGGVSTVDVTIQGK